MANPVKVGLIGLGRAGMGMHRAALRTRQDKFQYYAVCDLIDERCQEFAQEFGCKTYNKIEDILADPEVELIVIATRSCDHFAHAKMALLAGKDVFLEKPFSRKSEEVRELIALGSQPAGPHLYIRHNRRFEGGFMQVNDIIDSGILGDVYEIRLARNQYQRRADWQTISEFGGGQLLNWGPHIVDHSLRFCGGAYKTMYSNIKHVAAAGDCEDHIKIVFTGINDRIVDMEISGGVALPVPEYRIYGSKGSLVSTKEGFHLRYLDPAVKLDKIVASPATPDTKAGFGNRENLVWIEEDVPYYPDTTETIWDKLYDTLRTGKAFPIKLSEAAAVIDVIDLVKQNSIFNK